MYYVNREQIESRLGFIPYLSEAVRELLHEQATRVLSPAGVLAQERALHLAIEIVTDVGSLMIDGFIMRDASSYEDIVDILKGEGVFPAELAAGLVELVKLRKPLVQMYMELQRGAVHPLLDKLTGMLAQFDESVRGYLQANL